MWNLWKRIIYNLDFHMFLHIESEKPKIMLVGSALEIGIARVHCWFPAIGVHKFLPGWRRSCKWPVIVGIRIPLTFNPLLQYLQKDIFPIHEKAFENTHVFFWGVTYLDGTFDYSDSFSMTKRLFFQQLGDFFSNLKWLEKVSSNAFG